MQVKRDKNSRALDTAYVAARACLSCGSTEDLGRRRYCTPPCRQELIRKLKILTGLLRALHTRYATFSFTESALVLDLITYGSKRVYRFLYQRTWGRKPAQDLFDMTDGLGNVWWENKKRTGKRYRATQYLLEKAFAGHIPSESLVPVEINHPHRVSKPLHCLKLTGDDLSSSRAHEAVKSAYRREALKKHPDCGGDSASFRKINQAYQDLLTWLQAPELRKRKGLPEKWFFDGTRWIPPLPPAKKETEEKPPRRSTGLP
ncbi:MAG: J domain-containing protein [Deltaproteobacteria bacterium]|nr:J domain-containing protein [Deltaproteobacteria bacterium]